MYIKQKHLDGALVGVELLVLGLDHAMALEQEALANVALLLLLEHPLGEGFGLLALGELFLLGVLLSSLLLQEIVV